MIFVPVSGYIAPTDICNQLQIVLNVYFFHPHQVLAHSLEE